MLKPAPNSMAPCLLIRIFTWTWKGQLPSFSVGLVAPSFMRREMDQKPGCGIAHRCLWLWHYLQPQLSFWRVVPGTAKLLRNMERTLADHSGQRGVGWELGIPPHTFSLWQPSWSFCLLDRHPRKCPNLMDLVRRLFFAAAHRNFIVFLTHVQGLSNTAAYSLSRLQVRKFCQLTPDADNLATPHLCQHATVMAWMANVDVFVAASMSLSRRRMYKAGQLAHTAFCRCHHFPLRSANVCSEKGTGEVWPEDAQCRYFSNFLWKMWVSG